MPILIIFLLCLCSCGSFKQGISKFTGYSEITIDHVVYIQFPSGVTVKYNENGTICTR